jgi:uncharacterized protein
MVSSAGLLAGAMNALAGGGSFVSLPALIAAGVPPVQANASSTVALFPGGLASAWAYREGLGEGIGSAIDSGPNEGSKPPDAVRLRALLITTLCGGFAGAALLMATSSAAFSFVLPWLLLLASLTLAFGRRLGEALRGRWKIHAGVVLAVQFGLGIYGGYFGGAVGIMMIAMWGLLDARDLKSLNAPRTLLVSAANAVAVLTFVVAGAVQWPETLAMLVAAAVGGYAGAQLGRRLPAGVIRAGTLLLTFCITLVFFLRTYAPGLLQR